MMADITKERDDYLTVYTPLNKLARCVGYPAFNNDIHTYLNCNPGGGSIILTNENVTLPWDSAITDLTSPAG